MSRNRAANLTRQLATSRRLQPGGHVAATFDMNYPSGGVMAAPTRAARWISPLRYPGGKGRLATYLSRLFAEQHGWLPVEVFFEPFAGGAGAGLALLDAGIIESLWLVEKNPALAAFWRTVCEDGEALAQRVSTTEPTIGLWQQSRDVVAAAERGETIADHDLGFAAFMLNRCSRSGIPASNVGPIGGKHQSGRWTVASRFNPPELADRIRRIAGLADRILVREGDAVEHVAALSDSGIEDELLCFLDPPYLVDGPGLYSHSFTLADHVSLAMALAACPARWVLTYDNHPLIDNTLYTGFRILEYSITHTSNTSHRDSEYAVFSDNVIVDLDDIPVHGGTARWLAQ
ncbi:hypothetical protein GOOTI_221_00010 [Gordonia otitidis NBRC 100426]|uniref:DNA adenine methylase n=2 Tax=Gordonia otitidis TaxID=249058 RepID=H5TSK0_GORO1|nr:hypothetical protein GOOTI_221_00010 [Gordonia otitidis NBRC 100426]